MPPSLTTFLQLCFAGWILSGILLVSNDTRPARFRSWRTYLWLSPLAAVATFLVVAAFVSLTATHSITYKQHVPGGLAWDALNAALCVVTITVPVGLLVNAIAWVPRRRN